jgi:RNA polymerase sigma-70 factor, ECF subfamily
MGRRQPDDDAELIGQANAGDAAAFEALYHRYRDRVVALAYQFTGNRDDALDVLQETFEYFFGKFPGFELRSALMTFLYPAVKHLSMSRRRKEHPTVDIDDLADRLPSDDPVPGETNPSDLLRLVDALPEGQREVVLLRFVEDLSLAQIAQALELPLGTVKSRLHNALDTLRKRHR